MTTDLDNPKEILDRILSGAVPHDISHWLERLRSAQPATYSETYGGWYFARYHEVNELLRAKQFHMATAHYLAPQHPKYEQSHWMQSLKNLFTFMLPDDHLRVRKLVTKALSPQIVRAHRPMILEAIDRALDEVAGHAEFDFHDAVSRKVPGLVMFGLMGVPFGDVEQCLAWTEAMAAASDPVITDAQLKAVDDATKDFADYVHELTERRRTKPGEDIISGLIRAEQEDGRLTRDEFYGTVISLIVGGISLTQGLLSSGVSALLQNPAELAKLLDNPDLAPAVTEETLRYQTPLQLSFARIATDDLVVGDQAVKRGEICYGMLGAANFDPEVFEDPHRFRIDRPSQPSHLGLGAGMHFCVGAALGRAEGEVAFRRIFERMPDLELVEDPPPWRDGFMVRQQTRCLVRQRH